jgi:hypothetical protein
MPYGHRRDDLPPGNNVSDKEIVEIELPDGEIVLAHVEFTDSDVAAMDRLKLEQVAASAGRIAHWAKESALKALPRSPDRIGVQVGVTFAVRSGKLISLLAAGSTEAALTVNVEWDLEAKDASA